MTVEKFRLVIAACAVVATLAFSYWAACSRYTELGGGQGGLLVLDGMTGHTFAVTGERVSE